MKLLLSIESLSVLTPLCGPSSGDLEQDARQIVKVLQEDGRSLVTRQDLAHLLSRMDGATVTLSANGSSQHWPQRDYDAVSRVLDSLSTGPRRGFYSLSQPHSAGQQSPAEPSKAPVAAASTEVAPKAPQPDTVTRAWFVQQLALEALDYKVAGILKKKLGGEDYEDLLSEVRFWFAKWGAAGTCDEYINKGQPPTVSILVFWVEGKLTHMRYRQGRDALYRHTHGRKTQSEIGRLRSEGSLPLPASDPDAPKVITHVGDDGEVEQEFIFQTSELGVLLEAEELSLVQDLIRVRRKRAADRYQRFLGFLLNETPRKEVAALEGVSELRVTHLFQRVREDLREAPVLISIALKVLQMIVEEPCSTLEDLREETPAQTGDEELSQALELLTLRNLAEQSHKGSWVATSLGHSALETRSLV